MVSKFRSGWGRLYIRSRFVDCIAPKHPQESRCGLGKVNCGLSDGCFQWMRFQMPGLWVWVKVFLPLLPRPSLYLYRMLHSLFLTEIVSHNLFYPLKDTLPKT